MTTISIVRGGGPATIWARVYNVSKLDPYSAGVFTFEILAADAGGLERDIGAKNLLSADGGQVFWGELLSLESCVSTAPALSLIPDRPALRGSMRVYPDDATKKH